MPESIFVCAPDPGSDALRQQMKKQYADRLTLAGAALVWLPLTEIVTPALLSQYAALLLPGGGDPDPALWGEKKEPGAQPPDPLRDAADLSLFHLFYAAARPILGICRGMQIINIALGGSLHQDITPHQQVEHLVTAVKDRGCHPIRILPDTLLSHLLRADTLSVNSMHHQAVHRIAPSLRPAAYSSDGYAEALESADRPFLLGVQWHPEHLASNDPRQQVIFDAFVNSARSDHYPNDGHFPF